VEVLADRKGGGRGLESMPIPWTNSLNRHQSKMSSSKKIDPERDFAAGVYQSL
jgi:hypothetical protein